MVICLSESYFLTLHITHPLHFDFHFAPRMPSLASSLAMCLFLLLTVLDTLCAYGSHSSCMFGTRGRTWSPFLLYLEPCRFSIYLWLPGSFLKIRAWGLLLYVCPEARNINHWNSVPKRAAEPQTLSLFKAVTKVKKEYGLSTWK